MATTDARPVPKKNVAYRLYFDIRKNDGTLITSWAGQDTELSLDGGNYADATNEATEIQTSGTGYIDLTADEMNADCVIVKTTVTNTGALPFVAVLFPTEAADIPVDASASAVASVTAGVSLADDAITSAKFDESTAFPLASADAGATEVGRKGASAVTLSSISLGVDDGLDAAGVRAALGMAAADLDDQLDALPSAQEIWLNSERTLTQTAEQVVAILGGTALALKRGDTFVQAFTGLGDITGNKKIWFTVKRHAAETDAQSVLQIQRTVGAVYLNGAAATASDGSITVDDAAAGDITVRLKATASDDLPSGSYIYDIQWLTAADEVHTLYEGPLTISLDVTRAVA